MTRSLFRFSLLAFLLPLFGLLWACKTDTPDPISTTTDKDNKAAIDAYIASTPALAGIRLDTATGLRYLIYKPTPAVPNAKVPVLGEEVSFTFRAYNLQNALVDSTNATTPVYFPYGLNLLLTGLERGFSLMREGDRATLLMPSSIAYGSRTLTNLPAYSSVRFEVAMLRSLSENQQIKDYIATKKLAVTDSSSADGLKLIKPASLTATGIPPVVGQTVTVNYSGTLLRGTSPFDSGTYSFIIGGNATIKGFENTVLKMRVGEKATAVFPSALGYGVKGSVNGNNQYVIPPYAPLAFTIELVSIK